MIFCRCIRPVCGQLALEVALGLLDLALWLRPLSHRYVWNTFLRLAFEKNDPREDKNSRCSRESQRFAQLAAMPRTNRGVGICVHHYSVLSITTDCENIGKKNCFNKLHAVFNLLRTRRTWWKTSVSELFIAGDAETVNSSGHRDIRSAGSPCFYRLRFLAHRNERKGDGTPSVSRSDHLLFSHKFSDGRQERSRLNTELNPIATSSLKTTTIQGVVHFAFLSRVGLHFTKHSFS